MLNRVSIFKPQELDLAEIERWHQAQVQTPAWNSPFLHPAFAIAVARRREDTRVLVAEDHVGRHAWFAFHRRSSALARPAGAPVSDYQGLVCEPEFAAAPKDALREAGIAVLPFSALSDPNADFANDTTHTEASQVVDLSAGPDNYFADRDTVHRRHFKKMRQRARNMERDFGSGELVEDNADESLWQFLMDAKHAQYARTRKLDVLTIPWIAALLENLRQNGHHGLAGRLFGYRVGDQWAAAEFGLHAHGIYHSWIAAYDPQFSRISPGLLLMHGILEQAVDLNISQMDLGRGHEHYKKYYANSLLSLSAGCALGMGPSAQSLRFLYSMVDGFAQLPLGPVARLPGKVMGSLEYIGACYPRRSQQWRAFGTAISRQFSRT